MDTQLPAYEVFLQEKPGAPHQDVGSVHAADAEMALLNARDVFVRRPQCFNLWVVPQSSIFHRTRQEIEEQGVWTAEPSAGQEEDYFIFCKQRSAGTLTEFARLHAGSPAIALSQALEQFSGKQPPFAWCAFPARLVTSTSPEEVDSLFAPAEQKPFRMSTGFRTVSAMRSLKQGGER